jgi:predicted DNA-binding transcriptional regulator YafY
MNRIERLTATLLLLQERPHTSQALARTFEVSRRTVLRDVQALCEMGVPIIAQEGAGGGYSLPESYRLSPLPLSYGESFLLLLGLRALGRLSETPFSPERASLTAKVQSLLPAALRHELERRLNTVALDIPHRPERAPLLDTLVAAARDGAWLRADYRSAERRSVQHILPRQLQMQGGYWYCVAFSHERGEQRTYRVDRFVSLAAAPGWLASAAAPEPQPSGHESHPLVSATLTARAAAQLEVEPHLSRHLQARPDGAFDLALRCPPGEIEWYARTLAGFGAEVAVHGPPVLRERLAALGRELRDRYDPR